MTLTPRIILKPAFTVVGLSRPVKELNGSTEALWEQLGERYHEIPQADPDAGYGVHTWGPKERHYLAGLALRGGPGYRETPPGMAELQLEARAYAVFTHTGLVLDLPERVKRIYEDWLPGSGYTSGGDFYFEYYDDRFLPGSQDSMVFVYVPVLSPSPQSFPSGKERRTRSNPPHCREKKEKEKPSPEKPLALGKGEGRVRMVF